MDSEDIKLINWLQTYNQSAVDKGEILKDDMAYPVVS